MSTGLQGFIGMTLDLAVGRAIRAGSVEPLAAVAASPDDEPTILLLEDHQASLEWQHQLPLLRGALRKAGAEQSPWAAVLAYDTIASVDGHRHDAVAVEAYEAGQTAAVLVAQAYRASTRLRQGREIGNVMILRVDVEPLF